MHGASRLSDDIAALFSVALLYQFACIAEFFQQTICFCGSGAKQCFGLFPCNAAVFLRVLDKELLLVVQGCAAPLAGLRFSACFLHFIAVRKCHAENALCRFKFRLHRAGFVGALNLSDPCTVAFNQTHTVKNSGKIRVSGLRNAEKNRFQLQTRYKPAQGDKFNSVLIQVDQIAAAERVISVNHTVQQRLSDGLVRIILAIGSVQPGKGRLGFVEKVNKLVGILQLLQDRAGKLLPVAEQLFIRALKERDFCGGLALIREQQGQICVQSILADEL